jgi:thiamine pyrophosphokinase
VSETPPLRAIVLADGDGPERAALDARWPDWARDIALVIAADGGAMLAEALALRIDRWVGDGDSLPSAEIERLRATGVPVDLVPSEKDESDAELAVVAAVRAGATDLTILGGLGGPRLDHALANIALLAHPVLAGRAARLLDATTRVSLVTAPGDGAGDRARSETAEFVGRAGDIVSLLPLSPMVEGIVTTGLRYPLRDEALALGPARGLSNVRTDATATISVREGRLLVIESPATLPP